MTLMDIQRVSESMLTLAKNSNWDGFLTSMEERELLISSYENSDPEKGSKTGDIKTLVKIQELNDKLLTLSKVHQQEIQSQLIKLSEKNKASNAYRSR